MRIRWLLYRVSMSWRLKHQKHFHIYPVEASASRVIPLKEKYVSVHFESHPILLQIFKKVRYMQRKYPNRNESGRRSPSIQLSPRKERSHLLQKKPAYFNHLLGPSNLGVWTRSLLCVYLQQRRKCGLKTRRVLFTPKMPTVRWKLPTYISSI